MNRKHRRPPLLAVLATLLTLAACNASPEAAEPGTPTNPDDGGMGHQVYMEVDNTCPDGPAHRYIRFASEEAEAWYLRPMLIATSGKPRLCVGADVDPHSCRRVLIPITDPGENAVTTLTGVGEGSKP